MKRDLQEILDECVESILNGTTTLEECIFKLDGEMRTEVEPMLFAIQRVVRDGNVEPDPVRKRAGKDRLLKAVDQKRWESGTERKVLLKRQHCKNKPRRMMMRLAVIMGAIMALSSATVAFADQSLPGSPLYPVKRAVENAKISLTLDEDNKKLLYLQAAENRISELEKLADDGSNHSEILDDMADSLAKAASLSDSDIDNDNADQIEEQDQAIVEAGDQLKSQADSKIRKRSELIKKRSTALLSTRLKLHSQSIKPEVARKLKRLGIIETPKEVKKEIGEADMPATVLNDSGSDNPYGLGNSAPTVPDNGMEKDNANTKGIKRSFKSLLPAIKNLDPARATKTTETIKKTIENRGKKTIIDKADQTTRTDNTSIKDNTGGNMETTVDPSRKKEDLIKSESLRTQGQ